MVVEEERPRRLRKGTAEILPCYPVPVHFQNATLLDSQYYFSAELPTSELKGAVPFCVGQSLARSLAQSDRQAVAQSVVCVCFVFRGQPHLQRLLECSSAAS